MPYHKIHFNFGGTLPNAENMTPQELEETIARRLAFQFDFNRRINEKRLQAYRKRCALVHRLFPPQVLNEIGNPWE